MNSRADRERDPLWTRGIWPSFALVFALTGACGGAASQGARDASPDGDGSQSVTIKVNINNCPSIVSISASPLSASVGQTVDVVAMVTDQDATDRLAYLWTATAGWFSDALIAAPTYQCTGTEPGIPILTLRVSDGRCQDVATTTVTCL